MKTYRITRFYQNGNSETVCKGLSLEQAKEHCQDPETSSRTATNQRAVERTRIFGSWFDGYEEV